MLKFFILACSIIWCLGLPGTAAAWGVIQDGLDKIYDSDQALSDLATFRANQKDGAVFEYYKTGDIKRLVNYRDGKLHGTDKVFYENGKVWVRREFRAGQLQGKTRQYYPNGNLCVEINYVNNTPHGEARYYAEDGTLKQITTYRVGQVLHIKKYDLAGHLQRAEVF